ncbi:uncharacterized protein METZ01_LOCUS308855, partial [marine metagenome]
RVCRDLPGSQRGLPAGGRRVAFPRGPPWGTDPQARRDCRLGWICWLFCRSGRVCLGSRLEPSPSDYL